MVFGLRFMTRKSVLMPQSPAPVYAVCLVIAVASSPKWISFSPRGGSRIMTHQNNRPGISGMSPSLNLLYQLIR